MIQEWQPKEAMFILFISTLIVRENIEESMCDFFPRLICKLILLRIAIFL